MKVSCETFYGGHRFLKKMPFLVGFIFLAPQTIISNSGWWVQIHPHHLQTENFTFSESLLRVRALGFKKMKMKSPRSGGVYIYYIDVSTQVEDRK